MGKSIFEQMGGTYTLGEDGMYYYLAQSNIAESSGHFTAEIRNIAG